MYSRQKSIFEKRDKFAQFSDDDSDGDAKAPKRLTGFQQFYAKENGDYMK